MLRPFAVLALVVLTSVAAAQDSWPSKPITVIVPFGAGGNTDSLARIYSARLSARLGQQFVIENRIGAGSIIGITSLAKAAPDGYTIGVGTAAGLVINPAIVKENLGYNADKDFAYLHLMAIQPNLLVVHPSVPATSLRRARRWRRGRPHHARRRSARGDAMAVDAGLRAPPGPEADPRLRGDARGRNGRIREKLAAGVNLPATLKGAARTVVAQ
jgi:Tripartite tricarboxylate transporter family receptor